MCHILALQFSKELKHCHIEVTTIAGYLLRKAKIGLLGNRLQFILTDQ